MKANAISRRSVIAAGASVIVTMAGRGFGRAAGAPAALGKLESRSGGKLGVCILDTHDGQHIGHRIDERFGQAFATMRR